MADIEGIDPSVIKRTQETLGKFIKKPPLSEKLLKKPPFRYLHDVFNVVIRETGCFKGLYTADELNYENIKDRDDKMKFLQKMIDVIKLTTNEPLAVRTSKIVAGLEAEKTNELLQQMGNVIEKQMDWQAAVEKVLNGVSEESKANGKVKPSDKPKDAKVADKVKEKSKDKENKSKDSKGKSVKVSSSTKASPAPAAAKDDKNRKEKHQTSKTSKDKEIKEKATDKNRKEKTTAKDSKETKNKEKTRRGSKEIDDKMKSSKSEKKPKEKATSQEKSPEAKEKRRPSLTEEKKSHEETKRETKVRKESSVEKSETVTEAKHAEKQSRRSSQRDEEIHQQIAESLESQTPADSPKSTYIRKSSPEQEKNSSSKTRRSSGKKSAAADEESNNRNQSSQQTLDSLNNDLNGDESLPARQSSTETDTVQQQPVKVDNHQDREPLKRETTFTRENSKDSNSSSNRPRTSLRPPSARPPSARPGAPRRRDKNIEIVLQPHEQVKMSGIAIKLETFGDFDDDGENLVIIEDANTGAISGEMDQRAGGEGGDAGDKLEQQGHLVQQILETQKELVHHNGAEDLMKQTMNEKDSDATSGLNARQSSARQMIGLREVIQSLTKSINPLGKLMDFIPEDIDAMQLEMTMWRDSYTQAAAELKREKSLTESATEPMKNQLVQIEANIKEYEEIIDASRLKILQNAEKILKMLTEQ